MSDEQLQTTVTGLGPGLFKSWFPVGESYFQDVSMTGVETETNLYTLIMRYTRDFTTLAQELQKVRDEIQNLREELSRRPLVSTVNLYDLGIDTLRIKLSISVVLNETEEESMARWPETRAYGIGSTLSEAISDLKLNIATLFFDLTSRPIDSLGEVALDTLRILRVHLEAAQ